MNSICHLPSLEGESFPIWLPNCAENHTAKGQCPQRRQRSPARIIFIQIESTGTYFSGISQLFGACSLLFILNSQPQVALFLSQLAEVLGKYKCPKLRNTYCPFNRYPPHVIHRMMVKISLKPPPGREVTTYKPIKPAHSPLKLKSLDSVGFCSKLLWFDVCEDPYTNSSRTWLVLPGYLVSEFVCKDIHTHSPITNQPGTGVNFLHYLTACEPSLYWRLSRGKGKGNSMGF